MQRSRSEGRRSSRKWLVAIICVMTAGGFFLSSISPGAGAATKSGSATLKPFAIPKTGELDCNGYSPAQKSVKHTFLCADIRGLPGVRNANNWNNRFYDNGVYIGHDEPDVTFNSTTPGSGDNVTWTTTIGKDPSAAPTVKTPGKDVVHYNELTPAPWWSMAMCDGNSYPELPCTPESDINAPACSDAFYCPSNSYPGAGSAFMEFQLYPPGEPPWVDSTSCDDTHWCAALTIDSLECTENYATCNNDCEEPVNFAWISRNGKPSGPPSPQDSDLASSTPNSETLLMNPGDKITFHMWDADVTGAKGQKAFEVRVDDLTTHQVGWMQASAKNGFMNTSIVDCAGTPFNFQPEYSSAASGNIIPWAALQTNVSAEFETGHFEPCTSLTEPFTTDPVAGDNTAYNECVGPYETKSDSGTAETGDGVCYYAGDTHGTLDSQPDVVTGCQDDWFQNGDLDFDGTPYYDSDWPTSPSTTSRLPGSFVENMTNSNGKQYSTFFFQTDIPLSESTCGASTPKGCSVPPKGPGGGYPYWSEVNSHGSCTFEFGNVATGSGVTNFGKDAQYGSNLLSKLGYPEFEGKAHSAACKK